MFIIQYNDGRLYTTDIKAEAQMYAWLAITFSICNVYAQSSSGMMLPVDIR